MAPGWHLQEYLVIYKDTALQVGRHMQSCEKCRQAISILIIINEYIFLNIADCCNYIKNKILIQAFTLSTYHQFIS